MPDPDIDQLEFRWRPGNDLSIIASSIDSIEINEGWNLRLKGYAGFAMPERGARYARSSAVYLTFQNETAALLLRELDDKADTLFENVTPDRHRLVARALVGPRETLTPTIALKLASVELDGVLKPRPGRVAVNGPMERVHVPALLEQLEHRLSRLLPTGDVPNGLTQLVAAVLRAPHLPLTFELGQSSLDRTDGPAAPLLMAMHQLVAPVLVGPDRRPGFGWRPTFSTFETTSDRDTEALPAVTFQLPQPRGMRPVGNPPAIVRADAELNIDHPSNAAQILVAYYRSHGSEAGKRIWDMVSHEDTLEGRLRALCSGNQPRPAQPRSPASGPVQRPEPQSVPGPEQQQAPPADWDSLSKEPNKYGVTPETGPRQRQTSLNLSGLYTNLERLAEEEQSKRAHQGPEPLLPPMARPVLDLPTTVNWFRIATERRLRLRTHETGQALHIIRKHGRLLAEMLESRYPKRADERMADVLYPMFATSSDHNPNRVRDLYEQLRHIGLVAQSAPLLCETLPPDTAHVLDNAALERVNGLALAAQRTGQSNFDDDHEARQAENKGLALLTWMGGRVSTAVSGLLILVVVLEALLLLSDLFWF